MIQIRKAADRGYFDHGWLKTSHTFSFADYYDPQQMGFRALRVINEDTVSPGQGFGTHPHRDMEIITYILEGSLEHRDSMGNGSVIRPGEIQRMSAGTGVTHSEFNPSKDTPVHLLQIWILPGKKGIEPSYEQKKIPVEEARGTFRLIASPNRTAGAVEIHQDAGLYFCLLRSGEKTAHEMAPDRFGWLQVARGSVDLNGVRLQAGDGAALSGERTVSVAAEKPSELLFFDLA